MQTEQKLILIAALETFIQERNLSQKDVAEGAGVNASYLINMRKGDFTINVGGKGIQIADKYFLRVAEYIGFETERQYWETKATTQFKEILATLNDAKANAETAVITGQTGCGKSFSAELFKKKFPADVFIVTVSNADNLGDLLDKTLEALKLDAVKRTKSARLRQIGNYLRALSENGHEPTLIFDETEFLKLPALCAMKELHEALKKWCALVLIGTEQLTQNLEKLKKRNKAGMPQFFSRIKFRIRNLQPIDRQFNDFVKDYEPNLKRFLRANCDNYRELHDVLVPAKREAERTGEALTEDFVKMVLGV